MPYSNNINYSPIGQGIGHYQWKDQDADLIRKGVDLGLTLLDTCEIYDYGRSEEIIGKAIHGIRNKVTILTKFSVENSSYKNVIKSLENSLKRLRVDYVDIYQNHWPSATIDPKETFDAMLKLMEEGKTKSIGIGNFYSLEEVEKLYILSGQKISSFQLEYSLFDRNAETIFFDFCKKNNIHIISYSSLDKGRLVNTKKSFQIITEIANKYNKTPHQIVINWLINKNKGLISLLIKSSSLNHMIENLGSLSFFISEEDMNIIDYICQTKINLIEPHEIKVSFFSGQNKKEAKTLEYAMKNETRFSPSIVELSSKLKINRYIKPIRIIPIKEDGIFKYQLVEGECRYWAHVLAFPEKKIPSIIRENWESDT